MRKIFLFPFTDGIMLIQGEELHFKPLIDSAAAQPIN